MQKTEGKIMRLGRYVAGHPGLVTVIAVAAAVLAVYGQSLWFGYVNYDDGLITDRTWIELRELSWDGLRRMFAFTGQASFQPIRHLAFALVYGLWGIEPFGYHLFNLLFYLANLWVVFLVLKELLHLSSRFKDSRRAAVWAGVGTVWFAVHPVHVESVAWMISNKELLAG
ncbi:MAG: hypothetical protein U9P14_11650, partial [Gemmatimonadota bacterium]|nr:hypothetical protein [Gemmatimonadota bacterium]